MTWEEVRRDNYPATHRALTYLHIDNDPRPIPEIFRVADGWDLKKIEAEMSTLSGGKEENETHHITHEAMESELWSFVSPEDDENIERWPEFSYSHSFLNACFDGGALNEDDYPNIPV